MTTKASKKCKILVSYMLKLRNLTVALDDKEALVENTEHPFHPQNNINIIEIEEVELMLHFKSIKQMQDVQNFEEN